MDGSRRQRRRHPRFVGDEAGLMLATVVLSAWIGVASGDEMVQYCGAASAGGVAKEDGCGCGDGEQVSWHASSGHTRLVCEACPSLQVNKAEQDLEAGDPLGTTKADVQKVHEPRRCVTFCGHVPMGLQDPHFDSLGTEVMVGCGCPPNYQVNFPSLEVTTHLVCQQCGEESLPTPADSAPRFGARKCNEQLPAPVNKPPLPEWERPHLNAHVMDPFDPLKAANEVRKGIQNVHRVPDKLVKNSAAMATSNPLWPRFGTIYYIVVWFLVWQVSAWILCGQLGLWRMCPGTEGWHAGRNLFCSSHTWPMRRLMLPYECLNMCCRDRAEDGSALAPTAYNLPNSKDMLDMDAERLSLCDYPGLPPPAWYKTWQAAIRDGVCTMGQPVYQTPPDDDPTSAGGVYSKE